MLTGPLAVLGKHKQSEYSELLLIAGRKKSEIKALNIWQLGSILRASSAQRDRTAQDSGRALKETVQIYWATRTYRVCIKSLRGFGKTEDGGNLVV